MNRLREQLVRPQFPRSAKYDPEWVLDNQMGPNALWLMEWLSTALDLKPGMRVLDLGCGKALTSIFLAREFGLQVHAADLWIGPDHNWRRVQEAGVGPLVCPVKAEAHSLPFASGYFDAVVSVDSVQYFGTDELYIDYLSRFVRPGGQLGLVVVGLMQDLAGTPPAHLIEPQSNGKVFWDPSCRSFKTPDFWRRLWQGSAMIEDVAADSLADGWRHWRDFERILEDSGKNIFPSDAEAIDKDHGETIGFVRVTAKRTTVEGENMYDPSIGVRYGIDT
jgi:cyclopropane fatty-acyl-phospholipid synthase-like methyltransferase